MMTWRGSRASDVLTAERAAAHRGMAMLHAAVDSSSEAVRSYMAIEGRG
jgi:hypothetical protein